MSDRVVEIYDKLRCELTDIIQNTLQRDFNLTQKDYLFFLQKLAQIQVDIEDIKKELKLCKRII